MDLGGDSATGPFRVLPALSWVVGTLMVSRLAKCLWAVLREEDGQGVSEYTILLVLLVLIVVTTVRAIGMNAQQVIDKVNTALHIG